MRTTVKLKRSISIGDSIEKIPDRKLLWGLPMKKSLEESIVIQAIRDLLDDNNLISLDATMFFLHADNTQLCAVGKLSGRQIRDRVLDALTHRKGVRREKLVRDLLNEISRN